jgi:heme exporter protein C
MKPSLTWFTFSAPPRFFALANAVNPWLWAVAIGLALWGLYVGFFVAPSDAAWMSMILYLAMAFWAAMGWMFNARMASSLARAVAPTGALFTFIALWTGAFWGRPTWGTWWVWDARLTSELILLFLYLGYIALVTAIDDLVRGDKAGALLAIIGAVNVPIIYFSVRWWNTLHQGATISLTTAPKMAQTMLFAMLLMTFAFWAYAFAVVFTRAQALALARDGDAAWVQQLRKEMQ